MDALAVEVESVVTILEGLPVAAMVANLDGIVVWTNSSFADLAGWYATDRRALTDLPFAPLALPAQSDLRELADSRTARIAANTFWNQPGGRQFRLSRTATPLRNEAGSTTHVLWAIHSEEAVDDQRRLAAERYVAVVSSMSEGVVFQDGSGAIEMCNPSAENILGLTLNQMEGVTSIDPRWRAIHEDGSEFPGETHPAMVTLRTGAPQSNVIMGVHKPDGSLTWISINSFPIMGDGGEPFKVVTTFSDITAEKQMRDALRLAEEQRSKGFMGSPAMTTLSMIGADGQVRLLNVNEAFERHTGYRRAEAIGRTVQELQLWEDPDEMDAAIREFRLRGRIQDIEFRFRRKDGQVRNGLISADTIELGGRMVTVSSILDITAKHPAEQDLEARQWRSDWNLFNQVPEAAFVLGIRPDGSAGRVIETNDAGCQLLGYSREELVQLTARDLGLPEDSKQAAEFFHTLLLEGRFLGEWTLQSQDGRKIRVELHSRIFALKGTSLALICSAREIAML